MTGPGGWDGSGSKAPMPSRGSAGSVPPPGGTAAPKRPSDERTAAPPGRPETPPGGSRPPGTHRLPRPAPGSGRQSRQTVPSAASAGIPPPSPPGRRDIPPPAAPSPGPRPRRTARGAGRRIRCACRCVRPAPAPATGAPRIPAGPSGPWPDAERTRYSRLRLRRRGGRTAPHCRAPPEAAAGTAARCRRSSAAPRS